MKTAIVTVALSGLSLLAAAPAFAQVQGSFGAIPIESCQDYIAKAASQVQMATGCNFPGPRWSLDPEAHMNWCKAASPKDRGREDDERRKALMTCRGDFGAVPIKNCNEYTARSRSQVELAQSLEGCTFEGMRWSANLVQHTNWCNRNAASRHEFEDAARRKELAVCKATPK